MSTPVIILIVTVVIGAGCIIGCYFLAKRGAFLAINEKLITRIDKAIFPDEFHGIMIHLKSIRQTMGGASCRVSSAFISAARLLADKMDTPMLEELEKVTSLEGLKEYREKFKKMFEPLDLYLAFDGSPWTDWHACTDCPKWFIAFKKKTLELIKEKIVSEKMDPADALAFLNQEAPTSYNEPLKNFTNEPEIQEIRKYIGDLFIEKAKQATDIDELIAIMNAAPHADTRKAIGAISTALLQKQKENRPDWDKYFDIVLEKIIARVDTTKAWLKTVVYIKDQKQKYHIGILDINACSVDDLCIKASVLTPNNQLLLIERCRSIDSPKADEVYKKLFFIRLTSDALQNLLDLAGD